MKICPKCRSFYDETHEFCVKDGIPLLNILKNDKTFEEGQKFLENSRRTLKRKKIFSLGRKVFTYLMPVIIFLVIVSAIIVNREFVPKTVKCDGNQRDSELKKIEFIIQETFSKEILDERKKVAKEILGKHFEGHDMTQFVMLDEKTDKILINNECLEADIEINYKLRIKDLGLPGVANEIENKRKYICKKQEKWICKKN